MVDLITKENSELLTQIVSTKKNEQLLRDHINSITSRLNDHKNILQDIERLKNENIRLLDSSHQIEILKSKYSELQDTVESLKTNNKRLVTNNQSLQSEVEFLTKQKNDILTQQSTTKHQNEKHLISLVDEYKRNNTNLSIRIQQLESLLIENENKRIELRKTIEKHLSSENQT